MNENVPFTNEQLTNALYFLEDLMDRAQIPFFLLEGAAKQVYDDVPCLSLNQIDAGVEKKYLQQTGLGMLRLVLPSVYIDQNTISFSHGGVPIVIWIIQKNWKFFKNPNTVFFGICNFLLPNPFKHYWKSRFLIK